MTHKFSVLEGDLCDDLLVGSVGEVLVGGKVHLDDEAGQGHPLDAVSQRLFGSHFSKLILCFYF